MKNYKSEFYITASLLVLVLFIAFMVNGHRSKTIDGCFETLNQLESMLAKERGEFYTTPGAPDTVFIITAAGDTTFYIRTEIHEKQIQAIRDSLIDARFYRNYYRKKRDETNELMKTIIASNDLARDYAYLKNRYDFYFKYYEQTTEGEY